MYSLSRGGYIALLAGCFFLGLAKQRKLLILLIVFLFVWTAIVPTAVTERVSMTNQGDGELDHSSETRLTLWQDAIEVFDANVITGTGFATYAFMHRVGNYEDTHNLFLKVLVETGILGLILFLWLIARTFRTGSRLFRNAKDPFFSALGLGLAGWVVTAFVANCFGDRWMFLQVCGYLWVLAGLVARALEIESQASAAGIPAGTVGSDVAAENQQHQGSLSRLRPLRRQALEPADAGARPSYDLKISLCRVDNAYCFGWDSAVPASAALFVFLRSRAAAPTRAGRTTRALSLLSTVTTSVPAPPSLSVEGRPLS